MNPAWGAFDYPGRGGSELAPNIGAVLDRRWLAEWRHLRSTARVVLDRPPADRDQWAAWALGLPTTGPRYERAADAELRARWEGRRR